MQSVIILYRSHDDDLLALYETVGLREFGRILKESLRILARPGYIPKHKPPETLRAYVGLAEKMRFRLNVTSEKDIDIAELLSHVKYRKLNQFCKTALRFYLGPNKVLPFLLDIELTPVLSYISTGNIVARTVIDTPIRGRCPTKNELKEIDTNTNLLTNTDTITTTLPTQIMPSDSFDNSLDMTMGNTVVMNENDINEDDILTMLEGLM